jgi:hypothetical protein
MTNNKKKLAISVMIGLLFILLSLPKTYQYMDITFRLAKIRFTYDNCPGLPTITGIVINACILTIIAHILLRNESKDITQVELKRPPPKITEIDFGYTSDAEYESE